MNEYTTNTFMRDALTCPICKRKGTIRPRRSEDRMFGFKLDCVVEGVDGCGYLGLFEPDPDLWIGQDPGVCARLLQAWLDGLKEAEPSDAVSQLGRIPQKDREIEALRASLGKIAMRVHSTYHLEAGELDWTQCPYSLCCEARASLGIMEIE